MQPDYTATFPFLRVQFDGGSRDEGSAAAWVLMGRRTRDAPWEAIAFSGSCLGHCAAGWANVMAASEAIKALAAFAKQALKVDTQGRVVLPPEL